MGFVSDFELGFSDFETVVVVVIRHLKGGRRLRWYNELSWMCSPERPTPINQWRVEAIYAGYSFSPARQSSTAVSCSSFGSQSKNTVCVAPASESSRTNGSLHGTSAFALATAWITDLTPGLGTRRCVCGNDRPSVTRCESTRPTVLAYTETRFVNRFGTSRTNDAAWFRRQTRGTRIVARRLRALLSAGAVPSHA